MNLALSAVEQAVHGSLHPPAAAQEVVESVEIDTRRLQPHALFFALPGQHTDGHDHLPAAAEAGARAAVVRRQQPTTLPQIVVPDAAAALHRLAKSWRHMQQAVRIVAVTGSNGKTTVKEMLYSIMAAAAGKDKVLASGGNFNNHLGVPLTLLKLKPAHQLAVLEAGMDHAGELTQLSDLIAPHIVLINNAQRAHRGNFQSLRGIAEAKGELLSGLLPQGKAVLNADDPHYPLWCELANGREVIGFGRSAQARLRGEFTQEGIRLDGSEIPLALPGAHNKMNALAAAAAARALDLPAAAVQQGLAACAGVAGRLALQKLAPGVMLIDDTYNANPDSAAAALAVLKDLSAQQQAAAVWVMGDMLALGSGADAAHEELVESCRRAQVHLLGVGACMHRAQAKHHYGTPLPAEHAADALAAALRPLLQAHDKVCILVKGSRGMHMEQMLGALKQVVTAERG